MPIDANVERVIRAEELRLHVTELARTLEADGASVGIHTTRGAPKYQLIALPLVDTETVSNCVQIGPDELRRNYSEIRALIRINAIPFGIVVDGSLRAVLRRHPIYRAAAAEKYMAIYTSNSKEKPSIESRINLLETKITDIIVQINIIKEGI